MAHPKDEIGILELPRLRWLQRVGMGGGRALDQQIGGANALHDRSDKRMDRFDGGNDVDIRLCQGGAGRKHGGGQKDSSYKAHFVLLMLKFLIGKFQCNGITLISISTDHDLQRPMLRFMLG